MTEFSKLGIAASTQSYTFTAHTGVSFPNIIFYVDI